MKDEGFHLKEQRGSRILILQDRFNTDYDSRNGEMQTEVRNLLCLRNTYSAFCFGVCFSHVQLCLFQTLNILLLFTTVSHKPELLYKKLSHCHWVCC